MTSRPLIPAAIARAAAGLALSLVAAVALHATPIRQHPDNPHWFEFRGRAVALITSAEHYGAVLNLDFDFRRYLDALQRDGMNYTRLFAGSYVEPPGAFGIERNTLAPATERFLAPWARSEQPGYAGGGHRFDLDRFNDDYLARLRAFLAEADQRGIVVELTFFCSTYSDRQWALHPLNPTNHVQGLAMPHWRQLHTPDNGPAMAVQEKLVRWLVRELNPHENLIFEIQNEPWADNSTMGDLVNPYLTDRRQFPNATEIPTPATVAWQSAIAAAIADEEQRLPHRHLIAQNIANFRLPVRPADLAPNVSILNFHYAYPEAVTWNASLGRILGCDETGFAGSEDEVYRRQAWNFVLSGGGLFNHLDYSFTVGREDGTDTTNRAPGGGSPSLRRQLRVLSEFINTPALAGLRPDNRMVASSPGVVCRALGDPGKAYALYLEGRSPAELHLRIPVGRWAAEWISPIDGSRLRRDLIASTDDNPVLIESPSFNGTVALRITPQAADRAANPADPLAPIPDQPGLPRVLLIGDSISIGYTLDVRRELAGIASVHRIPENGGPTTNGLARLNAWLGTQRWDVIHFNWGLHDLKIDGRGQYMVPIDDYEAILRRLVGRLRQTGATLIWASTTPVPDPVEGPRRIPADVVRYNEAASRVMKAAGIRILDLYHVALPRLSELQMPHNVHFTPQGSAVLGAEVARVIREALTPSSPSTPDTVSFRTGKDEVIVQIGGRPVASYVFRHPNVLRPFLANLQTRNGALVSRAFPPVAGQEATDHETMHPGAWLAFGDLNGADFWRNKAQVEHVRFLASPADGTPSGGFIVHQHYVAAGETLAEEIAHWRFLAQPGGWLAAFSTVFHPVGRPLGFGDQEEMGFGIRVTAPLSVRNGGWMLDAAGRRGEREVWGQSSAWVACGGTVGGIPVALQLLADPDNFRASWFHARDYGLVVANPFGRKALTQGETSRIDVAPGATLRLGYGVFVHDQIDDRHRSLARAEEAYRGILGSPAAPAP